MTDLLSNENRYLELVELPSEVHAPDLRPVRRYYIPWMCCRLRNGSNQPVFVYGPRHPSDATTFPTFLFVLSPWSSTPWRWDCKGVLIPTDQNAVNGSSVVFGPVALKYRDLRRVTVSVRDGRYECPRSNGVLRRNQIDFAIPLTPYPELLSLPRRRVPV